jgi:hypothetical protein
MKTRVIVLGITLAILGGLLALAIVFPFEPATVTHAQTPTSVGLPSTLPTAGSGPAEGGAGVWWLLLGLGSVAMIAGSGLIVAAHRLRSRI